MSVYMIGTIRRDFYEIIGFRLYDTASRELKDCKLGSVASYINSGKPVVNLGLSPHGKPMGLNGDIERYAKFILGVGIIDRSPVVVIMQYANGDYEVVNGQGDRARMSEKYLLKYAQSDGLANAQIVNGHVVPISGQFEQERVIPTEKKRERIIMKQDMLGGKASFKIDNEGYHQLNKALKVVSVPEGVTDIAYCGFSGCELDELLLPSTLQLRCLPVNSSFYGANIKKLKLGVGIKQIDNNAFKGANIHTIIIAPTVRNICGSAFSGIIGLKNVIYYNRDLKRDIESSLPMGAKLTLKVWKGKLQ